MSRYNRTNFYPIDNYDNKPILDFTMGSINNFKIKRDTTFYTVRYEDIARPDLLSYKLYSRTDYWYFIAEVNDILDWWNDISTNDILQIPNEKDITDWFLDNK